MTQRTVIVPRTGWLSLNLRELWSHRELLFFLGWRDVTVRYRQTVLGALWAIIQPLMTMIVFTLFFGRLAGIPSDGVPYELFTLAALVPWYFFSASLTQSSNSIVGSASLLKKVYFPRLVIPISSLVAGIVDFAVSFSVLLVMMLAFGMWPTANVVWLPILLVLTLVTALGFGLWLSALNVMFRDVRYIVPFLLQIWLFATPIAYPTSLVPERWQALYALNPLVGVIDGFRWALFGTAQAPGMPLLVSSIAALFVLVTGALFFRRMERNFADVI